MKIKELKKKLRKQSPKTYAKIDARWDIKMIGPVTDFVFNLIEHINPKAAAALNEDEWLIKGNDIEEELWKLLRQVRRISILEKK